MSTFIVAQILGIVVFIFEILSIIANNKKKIIKYNTFVNIFSSLEYFLLDALSGAYGILVTFFRNYIFAKYSNKKKKIPFIWLLIILILLIATNLLTYDGFISVIPILTISIYTIALWQNSVNKFKLLNMFICFLSAIYNFKYGAYLSCLAQIIFIITCTISISHNIKKKRS